MKKATTDGLLYVPLKEFADRQSKIPIVSFAEKEIQTDLNSIQFAEQIADLYNQTQTLLQKMSSETKSSCVKENTDAVLAPSERLNNATIEKDFRNLNGLQKIGSNCITCLETVPPNSTQSPDPTKSVTERSAQDGNNVSIQEGTNNCNMDRFGFKRKPENEFANNLVPIPVNPASVVDAAKRDCDQNTEATRVVSANKFDSFQTKLRSANFVECVAFWYHLECEIEELPPLKRQKLDAKFTEVFGNDHAIDYYFLSDEQKSITCRKRIAKHVVGELTNHYNKKRIATKQLFKTMAKHITSILLGRSLYPGKLIKFCSLGTYY